MTDSQRFVNLSWLILECKYIYYFHPEYEGLTDTEYDSYESEYRCLAQKLSLPPSAADMVGFDIDRPSCRAVMERLDRTKKLTKSLLFDMINTGGNK